MLCPTCKCSMSLINSGIFPVQFHCADCGTLVTKEMYQKDRIVVPKIAKAVEVSGTVPDIIHQLYRTYV